MNLTPLIDIVFNLVIFFLVVSHFSQGAPAEGIELPTAQRGQPTQQPHQLTVTILPNQTYQVQGKTVTTDDIEEMLEQAKGLDVGEVQVRIQGDRRAPYSLVEPIMLSCAKHGLSNFGFDVLPEPIP